MNQNKDEAWAELLYLSTPKSLFVHFVKEKGVWKFDLMELLNGIVFKEIYQFLCIKYDLQMSENDFILLAIQEQSQKEVNPKKIWKPVH